MHGRVLARLQVSLWPSCEQTCSGSTRPPPSFNSSVVVFPSKNATAAEFQTGASRLPQGTRPRNLKDCSNKAVARAVIFKFKSIVAAQATSVQRGFVRGRTLVMNVPIIDAEARSFCPRSTRQIAMPGLLSLQGSIPFSVVEVALLPFRESRSTRGHSQLAQGNVHVCSHLLSREREEKLFKMFSVMLQGCPL